MRSFSDLGFLQKGDDNEHLSNSFPFSAVPFLVMEAPEFQPAVNEMIARINERYQELIAKLPSRDVQTEVFINY